MLESLILALAAQIAAPSLPSKSVALPSAELLEFLGEWPDDDPPGDPDGDPKRSGKGSEGKRGAMAAPSVERSGDNATNHP